MIRNLILLRLCVLFRDTKSYDGTSWPKASWRGKSSFDLQFHTTVHHCPSLKEVKTGRPLEAGADTEATEDASLWLDFHGYPACFLIEPKTTGSRMGPPTMDWALPYQPLIKKMSNSPTLWRHVLSWGSCLSDDYILCQVDIVLVNTLCSMTCAR